MCSDLQWRVTGLFAVPVLRTGLARVSPVNCPVSRQMAGDVAMTLCYLMMYCVWGMAGIAGMRFYVTVDVGEGMVLSDTFGSM